MRRAWLRWQELTVSERLILLEALCLMPLAGITLRLFSYHRLLSTLEKLTPLGSDGADMAITRMQRMGELANIAAWRGAYRATCLRRSLVLWWMLRRRGVDSDVRIGVRMENGEFASHAWVERQGIVLNDGPDVGKRYTVML